MVLLKRFQKKYQEKFKELMNRFPNEKEAIKNGFLNGFTEDELKILGEVDIVKFGKKYPQLCEYYRTELDY